MKVWEYECHEGTKLRFHFIDTPERKDGLKEFFQAPLVILQRLTSGRVLTSQLRIDAYEEARFWASQLGIGEAWSFMTQNFNKAAFQTDLANWFWEAYKKWPWVDMTPEERRNLKDAKLIAEVVDSDYEVVDEMPDAGVMELGENSPLTALPNPSTPTSPAEATYSAGTTETGSEDAEFTEAGGGAVHPQSQQD